MAPDLPDDVVDLLLDELAHPGHSSESYVARQETLMSACLASRKLYRLAQPSLWRQVAIHSPDQLERFRASPQAHALGRRTRSYTVVSSSVLRLPESVAVSALLPEVVDMRVKSGPLFPFRLASLEQQTKLRRLDVAMAALPVGSCATLPALEELCIRQAWSTDEYAREQLRPARLPRLRELFWVGVQVMGPFTSSIQLADVLSPNFLDQLDLVQTDWAAIDPSSDLGQSLDPPVLVMGPPRAGPPRPLSRHSISQSARFEDATKAIDTLTRLEASIRLVPPRPSHEPPYLLLLPLSLRTLAAAEPTIAPQLQALEALCEQSRVRIEWTDELPEGELVSPEFRSVLLVMSARLDDDVLVMILDELALPASAIGAYYARKETLRNVCLASHRLCRLAQPRLWRQVIIRSREHFELLVSAKPGALGRCTKLLTIVGSAIEVDEAVAGLSSLLPEVEEIRLASSSTFFRLDFALLGQYTNLRRLHVAAAEPLEGRFATLPALEELCLYYARTTSSWAQQQLRTGLLPRLRELYFSTQPETGPTTLDELVSPDVLRQLEILQVADGVISVDVDLATGPLSPILTVHPQFGPLGPLPRHTICHPFLFCDEHASTKTLSALVTRLHLTPPAPCSTTPPRLLILPPILRPLVDMGSPTAQLLRAVEALCVEKGVRIMWDGEQMDGALISPAFRRYARELREARALEG
ncbi:hypothetical protein JCM9279_006291 [Rhodotorula babjevae]